MSIFKLLEDVISYVPNYDDYIAIYVGTYIKA